MIFTTRHLRKKLSYFVHASNSQKNIFCILLILRQVTTIWLWTLTLRHCWTSGYIPKSLYFLSVYNLRSLHWICQNQQTKNRGKVFFLGGKSSFFWALLFFGEDKIFGKSNVFWGESYKKMGEQLIMGGDFPHKYFL